MASPNPVPPAAPARGGLHALRWFAAGLLLTACLYLPLTGVLDPTLDSSNYASYAYFAAHHFQYGTEVVPMYGPYGYVLPGSAYGGDQFWARLAGQLAGAGGGAVLMLWFFHRARGSALRWLWLGLTLALAPFIEDMPYALAILLAGLLLLEPVGVVPLVATAALLAFFSLIKGTHLLLVLCTLGVLAGYHLWQRREQRALGLIAAYFFFLLLLWQIAGQSVRHLPAFFTGIVSLSSGYNAAMGLDEPAGVFRRGVLALAVLAAGFAWGGWQRRREPAALAAGLLFGGFTFVFWKHGFVRADGHIEIFHQYAMLGALLWFLFAFARPGSPAAGRTPALVLALAALAAGAWIESPALGENRWSQLIGQRQLERVAANFSQLLQPARAKTDLDARLAKQRDLQALRLIREEVGAQPVDLFGVRQGILLLNELNYRPRPMGGGSFNAYNRYLMGLNRDFLRDPARRPPSYLLRLEPLDNHLGPSEDGLTLLELISRYRPVRLEDGYLLLQEVPGTAEPKLTPLAKQTFAFNESVPVPAIPEGQLLVARFKLPPSTPGSLRQFLYKAPPVTITLHLADGGQLVRRLVPALAVSTFLFSPTLDDTVDFARLFSAKSDKNVTHFTVQTTAPWAYGGNAAVEFYTMPRPAPAQAPDVRELLDPAGEKLFNVAPISIVAADSRPFYLGRMQVQPLHAPGRMTWPLDGTEYELVFDHGLRPEAWERGHGNGVAFVVELESPDAPPQKLFERLVDPFAQPAERRTLRSRVALPPHLPGSRLVLRTDPGPNGDNAWDWSYVTHLQLRGGHPPIFNRVPVALGGHAPVPAESAGRTVTLLHVPAMIAFPSHAADRRIHLEFGFLAGAYTGEGRTPGADFVVELVTAAGPTREIFRRTLDPVARPADRGTQTAVIELPAGTDNSRLVVRTAPAAGAGNSWGWTYFSRCDIE